MVLGFFFNIVVKDCWVFLVGNWEGVGDWRVFKLEGFLCEGVVEDIFINFISCLCVGIVFRGFRW